MKRALQKLGDLLVDENESYILETVVNKESVHVILEGKRERAYEYVLLVGNGKFYFGNMQLQDNSVTGFCKTLEELIDCKEQDEPLSQDAHTAKTAINRILRNTSVPLFMFKSYQRLREHLDIPEFEVLFSWDENELHAVQDRIMAYKQQLRDGKSIRITNIAAIHPLKVLDSGVYVCAFDPELQTYQTGLDGAHEFREQLRTIALTPA